MQKDTELELRNVDDAEGSFYDGEEEDEGANEEDEGAEDEGEDEDEDEDEGEEEFEESVDGEEICVEADEVFDEDRGDGVSDDGSWDLDKPVTTTASKKRKAPPKDHVFDRQKGPVRDYSNIPLLTKDLT